MATLEKTSKVFLIHFSGGGEPFLAPNLIEACIEITKRHYISFTTNLTSSRVREFAEEINPRRVVRIVASAHVEELERCRLLDVYIHNFLLLQEKGFEVRAREVAYPPLLKEVERYKHLFRKRGIELEFKPFFGEYEGRVYPFSYTDRESKIFGFGDNNKSVLKKHLQYKRICNAGYNLGVADGEGNVRVCSLIDIKIGNIYNNIKFRKNLIICPLKFCHCPFNEQDPPLFQKALRECKVKPQKLTGYHLYLLQIYKKIDRALGLFGIFLQCNYPEAYLNYRNFRNKYQIMS
ncbi:MAG: Radical SAM domain protein [Parcubacteria group bacterium GW2011_GWC2_45_7]|nr:MAG: Radical SAM domain protein [Parcubacteria group bacterium GW2011_GWC2_45_7]